jgi:23S rRNA pseudouridine1911/1915/1917 synthase
VAQDPGPPFRPQVTLTIDEAGAGRRLDALLAGLYPELSRSMAARLVKSGQVLLDGRPAKSSALVKPGQILSLSLPEPAPETLAPAPDIALDVIYSDEDVLVINKPAGLTVHPGAGEAVPTLAGALLALDPNLADVGPPTRPGLVHRLDKDTTGVMIVARHQRALESLAEAFAARRVDKTYLALVAGRPPDSGRMDSPIGRHPSVRTKMMAGSPSGKPATTIFRVMRWYPASGASLARLRLLTGRTHQARVHLASIGHPVLGDKLYGPTAKTALKGRPGLAPLLARQMLHARRLTLNLPSGRRMSFKAPLPADFTALLAELERLEGDRN